MSYEDDGGDDDVVVDDDDGGDDPPPAFTPSVGKVWQSKKSCNIESISWLTSVAARPINMVIDLPCRPQPGLA